MIDRQIDRFNNRYMIGRMGGIYGGEEGSCVRPRGV